MGRKKGRSQVGADETELIGVSWLSKAKVVGVSAHPIIQGESKSQSAVCGRGCFVGVDPHRRLSMSTVSIPLKLHW